jgi:serine O-acetyltransferase
MVSAKKRNVPLIPTLIQRFIRVIFSCEIPSTVSIGSGTKFVHNGLGVVVHSNAKIGSNCRIYQNVTIGGRHNRGCPVIGDNVFIGAGACVLGGVTIGDGAMIGANAVVITDVPAKTVVGGVPADVLRLIESQD